MPSNRETTTTQENLFEQFNRWEKPFEQSAGEAGFRIVSTSKQERQAGAYEGSGENSSELGWFISFYHNGLPVKYIRDIKVYSLVMQPVDPSTGVDAGQYLGEVELQELPLQVVPLLLTHHNQAGDIASFEDIRAQAPILKLDPVGAKGALLTDLRGYTSAVKIAFLDAATLKQINLAIDYAPEGKVLDMFFSGAEINYGEMASPYSQNVRFKEVIGNAPDPSISFTLKAEPLYQSAETPAVYESVNLAKKMIAADERVMLPGLFLLDSCKIYWRIPTDQLSVLDTL